ncbi:hypothetical protein FN846DRAFT_893673 [Sphaerosporella brunnea]|uniref:Uncharacterized protein n=1 Tax=Sphaerosporella brunnea TaxID=1250544 RepID=A0A5J5EKM6_9PEZI|nr:hypothetical protein FN846DRAFT_894472 [Sphaerosporella brunnea]KAA8895960.1 hypothetical protein FN846DRAFT_893673 [Sphaerosporella brunnea]
MAAFIRRLFQGRAAGATAPDTAVATSSPDAPDDAAVVTAAADGEISETTVPSPPTIPASDVKKAKRNAKRKAQRKQKARQQEKKPENDLAVTAGPASVSAGQKPRSIFVDCSNHTGMEIAWKPNDTGSGVVFTFRGCT